jgi:diacylglycerol kinase family enzyme
MEDSRRLGDAAGELMSARRLRAVVAAGGDGTAGLVVNCTPANTPITVFPIGTENLLSKYLRLSNSPEQVAEVIARGHTVRLDAGQVGEQMFLLMLSCGFDAEVVRRLHRDRRGNIHRLSYAKPIIQAIRKYQYPELRVYCQPEQSAADSSDSWTEVGAHWVFVFNIPSYAIGLQIARGATPFDGQLDVAAFQSASFWHALYHFGAVLLGQHHWMSEFTSLRTRRLRVEANAEVPYQLDGDPGGYLPVEIRILPQRLTLLVPDHFASATTRGSPSAETRDR